MKRLSKIAKKTRPKPETLFTVEEIEKNFKMGNIYIPDDLAERPVFKNMFNLLVFIYFTSFAWPVPKVRTIKGEEVELPAGAQIHEYKTVQKKTFCNCNMVKSILRKLQAEDLLMFEEVDKDHVLVKINEYETYSEYVLVDEEKQLYKKFDPIDPAFFEDEENE